MKTKREELSRKTYRIILSITTMISLLLALAGCSNSPTSANSSAELDEFVAQAIIDHLLDETRLSLEGTIVAHVPTTEVYDEPTRVWRYSQGQLMEADAEAFRKAVGSYRADWPPFTCMFAYESVTYGQAIVDVHTLYGIGITENSRGGYAQLWEIEKQSGAWVVTRKQVYMLWD